MVEAWEDDWMLMWRVCVLCIFTVNRRVSLVGIWKRRRKRTVKQRARARAVQSVSLLISTNNFFQRFHTLIFAQQATKTAKNRGKSGQTFFFLVSLQLSTT